MITSEEVNEVGGGRCDSLLDGKGADVADEGPDEGLGESGVVQVENVLNDVVSVHRQSHPHRP